MKFEGKQIVHSLLRNYLQICKNNNQCSKKRYYNYFSKQQCQFRARLYGKLLKAMGVWQDSQTFHKTWSQFQNKGFLRHDLYCIHND